MDPIITNQEFVEAELKALGLPILWRLHPVASFAYTALEQNEKIVAVIGGHYNHMGTLLIATPNRIIFVSHNPFKSNIDEFGLEMVTGIKHIEYGLYSTIILHTRMGDYEINKVNNVSAANFAITLQHLISQFQQHETVKW